MKNSFFVATSFWAMLMLSSPLIAQLVPLTPEDQAEFEETIARDIEESSERSGEEIFLVKKMQLAPAPDSPVQDLKAVGYILSDSSETYTFLNLHHLSTLCRPITRFSDRHRPKTVFDGNREGSFVLDTSDKCLNGFADGMSRWVKWQTGLLRALDQISKTMGMVANQLAIRPRQLNQARSTVGRT